MRTRVARPMRGGEWERMARQNAVDLGPKLVSAEKALATIRPGSRVYLGTGCAAPRSLIAGLEAMLPGPADLELVSFVTTSALPQQAGAPHSRYRHRAFFVGSDVRDLAGCGKLDYVPISLEEVPMLLASGLLPIDVALSRSRHPMSEASSASACPWTLRLRSWAWHVA